MTNGPRAACDGELHTTVPTTPARLVRLSTRDPAYLWNLAFPRYKRDRGACAPWRKVPKIPNCLPGCLVCISSYVGEGTQVCVFNPVNESFKVLPMLAKRSARASVVLVGTVSAPDSNPSFKVIAEFDESPDPRRSSYAIYSSISGEWKGFLGPVDTGDLIMACNGDLYTLGFAPPRLLRFSTEKGPLWNMALPRLARGEHSENEYLAEHRGRLLCCCDGIWMLDDARKLWVDIAGRCPPDILPPPNPTTQTLYVTDVYVVGDLVVFEYQLLCYESDGDYRTVDYPVGYDMLRRF